MMKDQETKINARWQRWGKEPVSKNFFIYFFLIFMLILSFFVLLYRIINPPIIKNQNLKFIPLSTSTPTPQPTSPPKPIPTPTSTPQPISVEVQKIPQNNEVTNLKQTVSILNSSHHHLVALEILREALAGRCSLRYLNLYLLRYPDPWTIKVIDTLPPIQEVKTYAQLQKLIVPPPSSSQSSSGWKKILSFFVKIKKLDTKNKNTLELFENIKKSLHENNIQQALDIFDNLPLQEQTRLTSWKQEAVNRLILEKIKQQLLIELAEG